MEQVGLVVEVKDDQAIVAVQRHDVCAKCGGCGVAVSGRGENQVAALNKVQARVGQRVRIYSDTAHVLKASFVVYILPLLALLLGLFLGQQVGGRPGGLRLDILLGLLLLFLSFPFVRYYDRRVAGRQPMTTVVEIVSAADGDGQPEDEQC